MLYSLFDWFRQNSIKVPGQALFQFITFRVLLAVVFSLIISMIFGKRLMDFQNTRMVLAEAKTAASVSRTFVESCIEKLVAGTLDPETAAMAKWWATDKQCEIIDDCVQLHGGYGYMLEYPVARMWTDGRIQKIWGGSNELMKDLIARAL